MPVPGLSNIEQLSGWHGLARNTAGEVWTWGQGSDGESGDGTLDSHLTPVRVPGLGQITAIAATAARPIGRPRSRWPLPAGRHAVGVGAGAAWSFAILGWLKDPSRWFSSVSQAEGGLRPRDP